LNYIHPLEHLPSSTAILIRLHHILSIFPLLSTLDKITITTLLSSARILAVPDFIATPGISIAFEISPQRNTIGVVLGRTRLGAVVEGIGPGETAVVILGVFDGGGCGGEDYFEEYELEDGGLHDSILDSS
jgi:hypothetical protein